MSSRKVASVFHRLFRKGRGGEEGAGGAGSGGGSQGSPARRLIRSHHAVTPSSPPTSAQHIYKNKQSSGGGGGGGAEQQQQCSVNKSVRSKRLMKELQDIQKNQKKDSPFTVELINDNLYEWHIRLYSIDKESELYADMAELGIRYISLQMSFPENFPFVPPFMRVISPKIEKGFVMEGGAICMELLTPRGWASAYTVEAIIMQFAASLVKGQGRISRKTKTTSKEFTKRVAEESFRSLVKTHDKYGWVTPPLADG